MRARVIVPLSLVLVLVPALTVWADHPPAAHMQFHISHFNGREDHTQHGPDTDADGKPGETSDAQIIGDLFDGIDHRTTLRAVASPETMLYEWHRCTGTRSYDPERCHLLARDASPVLSTPPPGSGIAQVAVFDATYDIGPPAREGINTLVALACTQDSVFKGHCLGDASGVHFDDSSNASDHPGMESPHTESGQFVLPIHGQAVANSGFTVLAFTSETDIGRIMFCLDIGTNASTQSGAAPENGCNQGSTWDPIPDDSAACDVQAPPNSDCWSATINPPDNAEFSLSIIEQDDPTAPVSSGSGDCEEDTHIGDGVNGGDDCQLDKIYLTSMVNPPPPPPAPWPFPGQPPPEVTGKCPGLEGRPGTHILGSDGDDKLQGTPDADVICGLQGNDTLRGRGGKDLLVGGNGQDRIGGGSGPDRLRGEKGRDSLRGGGGRDSLSGGPGRDLLSGGPGRDRCRGGKPTRSCER